VSTSDPIAEAISTLAKVPLVELQRRGYHFQRRDYYSALNDLDFLATHPDLWQGRSLPRAIHWDLEAQLALIQLIAPYARELHDVPWDALPGSPTYHWNNDFWRGSDALVQYGLLRHLQPARVVEIGCGWSSLLMARALISNEAGGQSQAEVHQIEPYPRRELMAALPSHWTRDETLLQLAPLERIEQLDAGDFLFYDGSHVARTASDVNWFFFEIVPRLASGVILHLHDIFWPEDYPKSWIFERGQTWNEQYVLQAFLMFNNEFEILAANAALLAERRLEFQTAFQGSGDEVVAGGSVWLRRK
jgi:predicted O-methyltransferase YrrM